MWGLKKKRQILLRIKEILFRIESVCYTLLYTGDSEVIGITLNIEQTIKENCVWESKIRVILYYKKYRVFYLKSIPDILITIINVD